jgi:D-alanyl-D-alanine carboxypeptidase
MQRSQAPLLALLAFALGLLVVLLLAGDNEDEQGGLSTGASLLERGDAPAPAQADARKEATPCPYCNQDAEKWRSLTSVAPPAILGANAAVIEGACGQLIFGLREHERRSPASIAKIVTALVVVEQARLSDRVAVQINGWDLVAEDGSAIAGLEAGMNLSVEELLYGMLLPSGNDAALTLAGHLGGNDPFVQLVKARVARSGLKNTQLLNPDGRDLPESYTSAFDIVVLGRELMANPELRRIAGTQTVPSPRGGLWWNTNYLVYGLPGATGVKFGYTEAANETVVGSAVLDGREVFISVLYSDFAYLDAVKLLNWALKETRPAC